MTKKGNETEKNYYDSNGLLTDKYYYKYNEKGRMIEEGNFNGDGLLAYKLNYRYENDVLVEVKSINLDKTIITHIKDRDDKKNWTKMVGNEITEREIEYY